MAECIMKDVDTNKDGKISVDEVLQANGFPKEYQKFIEDLFKKDRRLIADAVMHECDLNKDGKISVDEVLQVNGLEGQEYREFIEKIFKKYDADGDGQLNYDEFLAYLEKEGN
ncbi:unnamed protein product [Echinostoma caproni]|uniref:EF-hand domain-containing protein n=1 Tax=Echinostoma caproni TaxID=27848 RepID=A0A183B2L9_9TREM|nr:unnamed protein product [Echinostoma caproni]